MSTSKGTSVWSENRTWILYALVILLSNIIGALAVATFLRFLIPGEDARALVEFNPRTALLYAIYFGVAIILGITLTFVIIRPVMGWERTPEKYEPQAIRRRVLRIPLLQTILVASLWLMGVIIFGLVAQQQSDSVAAIVITAVAMGGATISLLTYLEAELLLRPLAAQVLEHGIPDNESPLKIQGRTTLTWLLTSALPIFGIIILLTAQRTGYFTTNSTDILPAILALALTSLVIGYLGTTLVVKSTVDPIRDLQDSITEVRRGNTRADVEIYDASEMGSLQAGFNEMLRGLRERQRINDIFGRYVGTDVAQRALTGEEERGGEQKEVAILFVDVIGSTGFAATHTPEEVVSTFNRYFDTVVEVVHRNKGIINKFEGDAAMAIFGAPTPLADSTSHALRAARELDDALDHLDSLPCGIGVATGQVVAGNIGAQDRFEYTVVGDAVNQAARLTEMAKDTPDRVLSSVDTLNHANPAEEKRWVRMKSVELRGRKTMTQLARPIRDTYAEQASSH